MLQRNSPKRFTSETVISHFPSYPVMPHLWYSMDAIADCFRKNLRALLRRSANRYVRFTENGRVKYWITDGISNSIDINGFSLRQNQ